MIKKQNKFFGCAIALLIVSCSVHFTACKEKNSEFKNMVELADNGELLSNPDMGWNLSYYANSLVGYGSQLKPNDYLDDYPCSTVFFRLGWNFFEPEEGKYNWTVVDDIADQWIARGKRVAFCWAATYLGDQSTPLWVREAGAQGAEYYWKRDVCDGKDGVYMAYDAQNGESLLVGASFDIDNYGDDVREWILNRGARKDKNYNGGEDVALDDVEHYRGTWVAYYDDPVFLEKLANFLKAAAEHYESDKYEGKIEFIEVGSFGDWGEQHASFSKLNPVDANIKRTHYALYAKYFKKTQLMVNDDAVSDSTDLIEYTKSLGFGVSDHSVQTGITMEQQGNAAAAGMYYSSRPVLLEQHNGTGITKVYYDSINTCHATYARINANPYMCLASEWTDKATLRLGYRLNFTKVSFSDFAARKTLHISFEMRNTGAAPCYKGGNPVFRIVNSIGRTVAEGVSDFNVKDLKTAQTADAAKTKEGTASLMMPDSLPGGKYYLTVSVCLNGEDRYNLPLENRDGDRKRYKIASFSVDY